jgi:signal transduction histidine kinase
MDVHEGTHTAEALEHGSERDPTARLRSARRQLQLQEGVIAALQSRIQDLEEKQAQIGSVLHTAEHAFLVIGRDGAIQLLNPVFVNLARHVFGRVPAPGDPVEDFVRDEDLDTFRANSKRAWSGETVVVTRSFEMGDRTRWFRFVYAPVSAPMAEEDALSGAASSGELGDPPAIILHTAEITVEYEAEQALHRSEERYRSIVNDVLDTSAAGLLILDADVQVVWVNQAAERFFDVDRSAVIGLDKREVLRRMIAPQMANPDAFASRVLATYADNTYPESFVCCVRGNETRAERYLEHRSLPIRTGIYAGGRIEHYYDVTDLKHAEQRLRAAQEESEAAREAKSRLASTVSHEIRTAMSGILGFAEMLLENDLDAESHHFAEVIHRSGESVMAFLNDVLDVARLEAGGLQLDAGPMDVARCAEDALATVRALAARKDIDLQLRMDDDLPKDFVSDELRLRQVLSNLLSNAVKFTDRGFVRLSMDWCEAEASPLDEPCLCACVRDTGAGISPEEQERLFEAFHQADSQTARTHGGSGLGLYIVERLVSALNGRVHVESTPGEGSSFHVYIPNET